MHLRHLMEQVYYLSVGWSRAIRGGIINFVMWKFYLVSLIISVGIGFYLYFFLKRALKTFGMPVKHITVRIILIVLAVCLGIISVNVSGFGAIITLHLVAFGLCAQLVNFVVKLVGGRRYREGFIRWKKIYGSGILPVVMTAALLIFGYFNLHNVVETHYTVYTNKNIRGEGYRVALIADVHFGVSIDYDDLMVKCQEISEKDVDIVVLCGDIVDNNTSKEEMEQVFRALGTIESEFGTFYVHGNHDRPMSILVSEFTEMELISNIEKNNITILQDETFEINGEVVLLGREDKSAERLDTGRMSLEELSEGKDAEKYILTLDHQPNSYEETGKSITDLVLSGHTHGGQLWPLKQIQEIFKINDGVYGHMWIDDDTQAIVTSGVAGWSYPVKTAAPAEYVIVNIVQG